jgi:hypothetical protein
MQKKYNTNFRLVTGKFYLTLFNRSLDKKTGGPAGVEMRLLKRKV